MNKKLSILCMALGAGVFLFACKKSNGPSTQQWSAGTGTYTINTTTFATNDTLAPDPLSGKKDVTMWPTTGSNQNMLFIYNIPTASSGTIQLTAGQGGSGDTTCFILGFFQGTNGLVNFNSDGVTGTITKTGATSFTFSATVYDQANPNITYAVQGSGAY
jgi:hypothetical protein